MASASKEVTPAISDAMASAASTTNSVEVEKEKEKEKPLFTAKEEDQLKKAWLCLKSGPPEVDIAKFAKICGFNTQKTAANHWAMMKKKLLSLAPETEDEGEVGEGTGFCHVLFRLFLKLTCEQGLLLPRRRRRPPPLASARRRLRMLGARVVALPTGLRRRRPRLRARRRRTPRWRRRVRRLAPRSVAWRWSNLQVVNSCPRG